MMTKKQLIKSVEWKVKNLTEMLPSKEDIKKMDKAQLFATLKSLDSFRLVSLETKESAAALIGDCEDCRKKLKVETERVAVGRDWISRWHIL